MVWLRQAEGAVHLEVARDDPVFLFSAGSFSSERSDLRSDPFYDPNDPPPPWFSTAFSHWSADNGGQNRENWEVAWWVIVTAYLPIWIGTLVMWQRHKARMLKASSSPPP
jgi:hypothetical protein